MFKAAELAAEVAVLRLALQFLLIVYARQYLANVSLRAECSPVAAICIEYYGGELTVGLFDSGCVQLGGCTL